MNKSFVSTRLFILFTVLLIVTACGQENPETTEQQSGNEDLSGSVVIDGSGTVYPFMALMAENYMINEQENVSVEVSRAGTSAGFKRFLVEGGTDFNNASRHIKDEESAVAEELGIEVKELKVALDGLTIVVHPENSWAAELTEQEVVDIFLAGTGIKNWSDVREGFPNEPIEIYGPNENHGTYEFFVEEILEKQDLVEGANLQQDYSTLVELVSQDKNAIGFFGYGYYANNQDKLRGVNIDFGNGPVEPSLDTIAEDGDYAPFTRAVFTYLNVNNAKEKPQVFDYAIYTMENAAEVAIETGFAPLPEEELQSTVAELETLK